MEDNQGYAKFVIKSLRDTSTKSYDSASYDRDIRAIARAIKSSLPKDAFYSIGDKEIGKRGGMTLNVYSNKENETALRNTLEETTKQMFYKGSLNEKYSITQRKTLSEAEQRTLIKEELSRKQEQENKDKEQQTRGTGIHLFKITALLTLIGDITRRILTNVLDRASESVAVATSAHDAGISYKQAMELTHAETKAGLPSGIFMNAIRDLQSKLVDEFSLDSSAISNLGVLLGPDLQQLVESQLKAGNGVEALALILDKVNAIVSSGMTPAGRYEGPEAARVKMLNYLEPMFPQLAAIFSKMQEQATNVNSIYKGTFDVNDFSSWLDTLLRTNNRDYGTVEQGLVQTMGELNNSVKDLWERLKESITVTLAPVLIPILRRIANLRFGLSDSENLRLDRSNYAENEAYQRELEDKLASLPTDTTGMSAKEKAYLQATREVYEEEIEAVKKENAKLAEGGHVMGMRRTPNELSRDIGIQYSENVYGNPYLYSDGNSEAYLESLREVVYARYTEEEIKQAKRKAAGYSEAKIEKEVEKRFKVADKEAKQAAKERGLLTWNLVTADRYDVRQQYLKEIDEELSNLPVLEETLFLEGLYIDAGKLAEREAAAYREHDVRKAESNKFMTAALVSGSYDAVADEMITKGTSGYLVGSNRTDSGERKGEVYLVIKDDKTGAEVGRKLIYSGSGQTVYEGEIDMVRKGENGDWVLNMTTNNAKQTPASQQKIGG